MTRTIILAAFIFTSLVSYEQNGYLVLKKGQKTLQTFWKNGHFTFQMKDGQWITGIITKVTPDSFYFTQEIIRYLGMGTDTMHFSGFKFDIHDVQALPRKENLFVYENDQVRIIPGHVKFLWVKNGLIFQLLGGGYVGVSIINDLINNNPPFAKENLPGLAIGTSLFLVGTLLHLNYDPYIHIGKKYHFESVIVPE
ncbi:MAG TPA: hypothetical protein VMI12_13185 [Puia sp.]|nr:hypothetical protein [Puia sp.]